MGLRNIIVELAAGFKCDAPPPIRAGDNSILGFEEAASSQSVLVVIRLVCLAWRSWRDPQCHEVGVFELGEERFSMGVNLENTVACTLVPVSGSLLEEECIGGEMHPSLSNTVAQDDLFVVHFLASEERGEGDSTVVFPTDQDTPFAVGETVLTGGESLFQLVLNRIAQRKAQRHVIPLHQRTRIDGS